MDALIAFVLPVLFAAFFSVLPIIGVLHAYRNKKGPFRPKPEPKSEPEPAIELGPRSEPEPQPEWGSFAISVPGSELLQPSRASGLIRAICDLTKGYAIVFRIVFTKDDLAFVVHAPLKLQTLKETVGVYYRSARVSVHDDNRVPMPFHRKYTLFKRSTKYPFFEVLRDIEEFKDIDPLSELVASQGLQPNEKLVYELYLFATLNYSDEHAKELLTMPLIEARNLGLVHANRPYVKDFGAAIGQAVAENWLDRDKRHPRYELPEMSRYKAKLSQTVYRVGVALRIDTQNSERFNWFDVVASGITRFSHPKFPLVTQGNVYATKITSDDEYSLPSANPYILTTDWAYSDVEEDQNLYNSHSIYLTANELAAFWHLPYKGFELPNTGAVQVQMPRALSEFNDGIFLGNNHYGDLTSAVHLPDDDRTTHTMIIGKTATGKSSLMHRMIHEDIAAGRGLCVVDPHGELVGNILSASIPDGRIDDVVVIDLSNTVDGVRYPPPLNPLFKVDHDEVSLSILAILHRVYGEFAGTQMEYLLRIALRTLGCEEEPTLNDVRRIYNDLRYRSQLVAQVDSISLASQWQEFQAKGDNEQKKDTFPLFRRLDAFYDSNELLAITCHPKPLSIARLVAENKIILVNIGSTGNKIAKSERLILGSSIVAQIQEAAMAGMIKQPPFMLYIDETQNFVHTPLDEMLSEVRKNGLGMTLANQFLKQLTGETQDAIEGNVGTMFSFEIGQSDASAMSHYMNTFEADDLTRLGKFRAAVSMRFKDQRQDAFTLETVLPPGSKLEEASAQKREQEVRRRSVENYTPMSYDEVIKWLRDRYAPGSSPTPPDDDPNNEPDDNPGDEPNSDQSEEERPDEGTYE